MNPDHFVSAPFTLTLTPFPYPNTDAPRLTKSILSPIIINLGDSYNLALSKIKDVDEDDFIVTVNYISSGISSKLPSWV